MVFLFQGLIVVTVIQPKQEQRHPKVHSHSKHQLVGVTENRMTRDKPAGFNWGHESVHAKRPSWARMDHCSEPTPNSKSKRVLYVAFDRVITQRTLSKALVPRSIIADP